MSLIGTWAARLLARTRRAQHNDFDYDCRYWWGDRHPRREDRANRELSGAPSQMPARRCLVCRPYTDAEALAELEPTDPALDPARC